VSLMTERGLKAPDAPTYHRPGRKCQGCKSRVSRYQGKTEGILMCYRCQHHKTTLGMSASEFARKTRPTGSGHYERDLIALPGLMAARAKAGLSRLRLSWRANVSDSTVKRAETSGVGREVAAKIANALGVTVEDLT
jgi:DNA-binding XRE family transcriptional regulator